MTDDDNWIQSAIIDPNLVAHLLFNLRHSSPPPKTWTVRQRRSKPSPPAKSQSKPPANSARASPTTPLSWSGNTSVSAGDGEESCRRPLHDGDGIVSRSKVIGSNETTPTKRPRKKKTLAELKDDEMKLLKERKQLKRQLANLQATCQKQRKYNESLKKMKDDMKSQVLVGFEVNDCTDGRKNDGFVLPDLNIPAGGEDY
ncbi:hypothetical protein SSX86_015463 [Deinandra increscens subsp. villosa]|uniref:Uncharacterized protein n=1 Tax=Deinandra increscens subsp. villosa TaxID=3103831 RepID=A0AAP0GY97_9ASTR